MNNSTAPLQQFDQLTMAERQRCMDMLDTSARSTLELMLTDGKYHNDASGTTLWLNTLSYNPDDRDDIETALWWCLRRGLCVRSAEHTHMIRFL